MSAPNPGAAVAVGAGAVVSTAVTGAVVSTAVTGAA